MIHCNKARCRVCKTVVLLPETQPAAQYETCSCGAIAIAGGKERLKRQVRSWSDLEELSEYTISWKDVLDNKGCRKLSDAATNARLTGHLFFVFDGSIYRGTNNDPVKTDKTVSDLDGPLPCLVRA